MLYILKYSGQCGVSVIFMVVLLKILCNRREPANGWGSFQLQYYLAKRWEYPKLSGLKMYL